MQDPDRDREREGVETHELEEYEEHAVVLCGAGGDSYVPDAGCEGGGFA